METSCIGVVEEVVDFVLRQSAVSVRVVETVMTATAETMKAAIAVVVMVATGGFA